MTGVAADLQAAANVLVAENAALTQQIVDMTPSGIVYFVDPDGSDSNSGLSPREAFRTFVKARTKLKARDELLLKAGAVYLEKLEITAHRVRVGVYGAGAMPVIDGSIQYADDWTQVEAGLWQHSHLQTQPSGYEGAWAGDGYGYAMAQTLDWCRAHAGSFYMDTAAQKVYVRPRAGDTPQSLRYRWLKQCVQINGAQDVKVSGLELRYGGDGLHITTPALRPEVSHCFIHRATYAGIESSGNSPYFHHNRVEYCGMNRGGNGYTIFNATSVNVRVEDNAFAYNGGHPLFGAENNGGYSWGGDCMLSSGAVGVVERNTCIATNDLTVVHVALNLENAGGGCVLQFNDLQGKYAQSISLSNAGSGSKILNNRIEGYQPGQIPGQAGSGIMLRVNTHAVTVKGNIIASEEDIGVAPSMACIWISNNSDVLLSDENQFWQPLWTDRIALVDSTRYSLAQWQALGHDLNSTYQAPGAA